MQGPGVLAAAKILKSLATSLADALMADFFCFCLFCYYLWVLLVSRLIERHAVKIQGRKYRTTKTRSLGKHRNKFAFFPVLIYLTGTMK